MNVMLFVFYAYFIAQIREEGKNIKKYLHSEVEEL